MRGSLIKAKGQGSHSRNYFNERRSTSSYKTVLEPSGTRARMRPDISGDIAMLEDNQFPPQSESVGKRLKGLYMGLVPFEGELIRDDTEVPGIRLVRLDDGKFLFSTAGKGDVFQ